MAKNKSEVNKEASAASPDAGDKTKPQGNEAPPVEGDTPVIDAEPQVREYEDVFASIEGVDEDGIPWKNRFAESQKYKERADKTQSDLQEAQSKYERILEASYGEQRERVAQAPQVPAEVEALYAEAEEVGFTRSWVDGMFKAQNAQNQAQMERFRKDNVEPYAQANVESSNRREVRYLVGQDKTMATYEGEIMDELRNYPVERHNPDAPARAVEIVKGRHATEIIKVATSDARAKAAEDRKIISNSPSSATITLESGQTVELSAKQRELCKRTGIPEEQYAADLLKHRQTQGALPPREMIAE